MQEMFSAQTLDKIMRRGNDRYTAGSKMPSELYQVAVFFSRPVTDEIEYLDANKWDKLLKQESVLRRGRLRAFLEAFPNLCAIEFEKQRFIFPLYSQEVFTVQADAVNYIPFFIKKLITDGKLPESVIKEDKSVDDDQIKTAIVPLQVTFLERDLSEFKSEN
jgi:hypothetical protein